MVDLRFPMNPNFNSPELLLLGCFSTEKSTSGQGELSADTSWNLYLPLGDIDTPLPTPVESASIPSDDTTLPFQSCYALPDLSARFTQTSVQDVQTLATGLEYFPTEFGSAPSDHFPFEILEMQTLKSLSGICDSFTNSNEEYLTVFPVDQSSSFPSRAFVSSDQSEVAFDPFDVTFATSPASAQSTSMLSGQHLPQSNSIASPPQPTESSRQADLESVTDLRKPLPQLSRTVACPHCSKHFAMKGRQFK